MKISSLFRGKSKDPVTPTFQAGSGSPFEHHGEVQSLLTSAKFRIAAVDELTRVGHDTAQTLESERSRVLSEVSDLKARASNLLSTL